VHRGAILVAAAIGALVPGSSKADDLPVFELVFPQITMGPNEAFEEFSFVASCGRVDSITWMPELWNIMVGRDATHEGTFRAWTSLGTAALSDTRGFDRAIRVRPLHRECVGKIKLTGVILVRGQPYRSFKLSTENLRLLKDGNRK
jgi:hypothetical protein